MTPSMGKPLAQCLAQGMCSVGLILHQQQQLQESLTRYTSMLNGGSEGLRRAEKNGEEGEKGMGISGVGSTTHTWGHSQ